MCTYLLFLHNTGIRALKTFYIGVNMQIRKLRRLLNEMVAKDPMLDYKEACIDRQYVEVINDEYRYIPFDDVEVRNCVWEAENTINECKRDVVVLGNY